MIHQNQLARKVDVSYIEDLSYPSSDNNTADQSARMCRLICAFVSRISLNQVLSRRVSFEPRSEKTGLRGFRPGPTQTGLYSYRIWLEAGNFGFR